LRPRARPTGFPGHQSHGRRRRRVSAGSPSKSRRAARRRPRPRQQRHGSPTPGPSIETGPRPFRRRELGNRGAAKVEELDIGHRLVRFPPRHEKGQPRPHVPGRGAEPGVPYADRDDDLASLDRVLRHQSQGPRDDGEVRVRRGVRLDDQESPDRSRVPRGIGDRQVQDILAVPRVRVGDVDQAVRRPALPRPPNGPVAEVPSVREVHVVLRSLERVVRRRRRVKRVCQTLDDRRGLSPFVARIANPQTDGRRLRVEGLHRIAAGDPFACGDEEQERHAEEPRHPVSRRSHGASIPLRPSNVSAWGPG